MFTRDSYKLHAGVSEMETGSFISIQWDILPDKSMITEQHLKILRNAMG